MPPRRHAPPFWFVLCVGVVLGVAVRALAPPAHTYGAGDAHTPQVQYAFWPLVILIASAIWKGIEVAGRVTLAALVYIVKALQLFATATWNGMKAVAHVLQIGLKAAWSFFRLTYDKVIKPAVLKFWKLYDKFRRWLDDTFGPVLKHLKDLRDSILCFYKTWVRPWLDLIDVTRRALRVLKSLGLKWAGALDAKLGALEDKIERPFRYVLAKVNEVINLVNRVITLDGLIQRLALIRSLERDYVYAWRAAMNPWRKALTESERTEIARQQQGKSFDQVATQTRQYMRDRSGPSAPLLEEMTLIWRSYLVKR